MNFFFHINVIFLVLFLTSKSYAQNQIVADLSQENVEISTDFQGAKILLFGAYDGKKGDDIITASGTTLLGADDKAGVSIIMTAINHLLQKFSKIRKIEKCFYEFLNQTPRAHWIQGVTANISNYIAKSLLFVNDFLIAVMC